MPSQTEWYIPQHIIYNRFWGEVSEEDLARFLTLSIDMTLASTTPLVHTISELSGVTQNLSLIQSAKVWSKHQMPPNAGWAITVGEKDPLIKMISTAARRSLKLRIRAFDTLQQALEFLKHTDPLIKWDEADKTRPG